jgi:hypothetical protein
MKAFRAIAGVVLAALMLAGCDSSDSVAVATYRVLHAVPDAPRVNVLIDGEAVASEVDYKGGTGFVAEAAGTYSVQVDALIPGGVATVIGPADVPLTADTESSIIAVGKAGTGTIEPLIRTRDVGNVAGGSARAEVLHGAPDAPPVDVYVTAPNAALGESSKLGDTTIAFKDSIGPVEVPAGTYQIRVTLQDQTDPDSVVFDSGEVELADGADLLIVAVEATGAGVAPISLLLWGESGVIELLDKDTPANLRVVHASPDTPAVDVVVNGDFANPLVPGIEFPEVVPAQDYASVAAGTYEVIVTDSATQGLMPIMQQLTVAAGSETTVAAVDFLANVRLLLLADDNRRLATAAKVRLVHGAPSAGPVDIYVTAAGDIADVDPNFEDVPFEADTGYVELAEGSYVVTVTGPDSKTPAFTPVPVTVINGGVYTAIVRDEAGGGAPFSVITLDDF